MSVQISVDPISFKKLDKRFKILEKAYPEETFRAIVSILLDIKLIAQEKIKKDGHVKTSRLRNSIFVKTPGQKYANRQGNQKGYTDKEGGSFNADLNVNLRKFEGAVGSNVEYAAAIEKGSRPHDIVAKNVPYLKFKINGAWVSVKKVKHPGFKGDSFLEYAVKKVNVNKWFQKIPKWANKKI